MFGKPPSTRQRVAWRRNSRPSSHGAFASPACCSTLQRRRAGYAPLEGGSITIRGSATAGRSRVSRDGAESGGLGGESLRGSSPHASRVAVREPPGRLDQARRDSNIGGAALSQVRVHQGWCQRLQSCPRTRGGFHPHGYRRNCGTSTVFNGVDAASPSTLAGGLYSANTRLIAEPPPTTSVNG